MSLDAEDLFTAYARAAGDQRRWTDLTLDEMAGWKAAAFSHEMYSYEELEGEKTDSYDRGYDQGVQDEREEWLERERAKKAEKERADNGSTD